MLELKMTAGNENEIIWFMKITTGSAQYYFATQDVTLTNAYKGNALVKGAISDLTKSVDISKGGNIGTTGMFSFNVDKNTDVSGWSNFINDFAPESSEYLTNAVVEVGIGWQGITLENQITWLYKYNIEGIEWTPDVYQFTNIDFLEFESTEIPFYEIQKSYDNGVSYYPGSVKEAYGELVPIIYGKFPQTTTSDFRLRTEVLCPIIMLTDDEYHYKVSSHPLKQFSTGQIYQYDEGIKGYVNITGTNETVTNDLSGASGKLIELGGVLKGQFYYHPIANSGTLDFSASIETSISNLNDLDKATYITLAPTEAINLLFSFDGFSNFQDKQFSDIITKIYSASASGTTSYSISALLKSVLNGNDFYNLILINNTTQDPGDDVESINYNATTTPAYTTDESIFKSQTLDSAMLSNLILNITNTGANSLNLHEVFFELQNVPLAAATFSNLKKKFRFRGADMNSQLIDYDYLRDGIK